MGRVSRPVNFFHILFDSFLDVLKVKWTLTVVCKICWRYRVYWDSIFSQYLLAILWNILKSNSLIGRIIGPCNWHFHCLIFTVHGQWSSWSEYGNCSNRWRGQKERTRKCDSPAPKNGGNDCLGVYRQKTNCCKLFYMKINLLNCTTVWDNEACI